MMADATGNTEYLRGGRGIAVLWFAVLAGPLAWMLGLNAEYSLVRVACAKNSNLSLHLVSLATLLLALAGGWVAWREWKRTGREGPGEAGGTLPRSRMMVVLGLMASALFSLAILTQWVASLFFNPCMAI
jgi:nicotinamide riboside transporter PnuC